MGVFLVFLLLCFIIFIVFLVSSLYVVRQQSVAIIERFGRYQTTSASGIHMRLPFGMDRIAARVQLRLLQSELSLKLRPRIMFSLPSMWQPSTELMSKMSLMLITN